MSGGLRMSSRAWARCRQANRGSTARRSRPLIGVARACACRSTAGGAPNPPITLRDARYRSHATHDSRMSRLRVLRSLCVALSRRVRWLWRSRRRRRRRAPDTHPLAALAATRCDRAAHVRARASAPELDWALACGRAARRCARSMTTSRPRSRTAALKTGWVFPADLARQLQAQPDVRDGSVRARRGAAALRRRSSPERGSPSRSRRSCAR